MIFGKKYVDEALIAMRNELNQALAEYVSRHVSEKDTMQREIDALKLQLDDMRKHVLACRQEHTLLESRVARVATRRPWR